MKTFEGQRSDRFPIKRSASEKEAQLRTLRKRLSEMKTYESGELRESITRKIAELEVELQTRGAPRPR